MLGIHKVQTLPVFNRRIRHPMAVVSKIVFKLLIAWSCNTKYYSLFYLFKELNNTIIREELIVTPLANLMFLEDELVEDCAKYSTIFYLADLSITNIPTSLLTQLFGTT